MHIDQFQIVLELDPSDYLCKHNWWLQFSTEEYLPYQQTLQKTWAISMHLFREFIKNGCNNTQLCAVRHMYFNYFNGH